MKAGLGSAFAAFDTGWVLTAWVAAGQNALGVVHVRLCQLPGAVR